jgi:predicted MFS family arabinose efflux permease
MLQGSARTPDFTARSWVVLTLYVLLNALNQFEWLRYAPVASETARLYGVDLAAVGTLAQIFPLIAFLLSLPLGWMVDRFGLRASLWTAAILSAAGALLRCGGGYDWALAGQVLFALAQPLMVNSVGRLALVWFHGPARLRATGIATMSIYVGLAIAFLVVPLLGGALLASLWGDALFTIVLAAATLALVPRDPVAADVTHSEHPSLAGSLALLRNRRFLLIITAGLVGNGFFAAVSNWLESIVAPQGFSSGQAGLAGLLLLVGGIIGAAVLPGLVTRPERLRPIVVGAVALSLPATALLISTASLPIMLVAALVLGFALLSPLPVLIDIVQRIGGHALSGIALSLFWLVGNFAAFAGARAMGMVAESGDWHTGSIALLVTLVVQISLAFASLAPAGLQALHGAER